MTLSELFAVLDNQNANVTVNDNDGVAIIKFGVAGYANLTSTLLAREVDKVLAKSANEFTITLKEA